MKNLTFIFLLLVFQNTNAQQNLVPNGDAENYTYRLTPLDQVDALGGFSSRASPYYFNRCSSLPATTLLFNLVYGFKEPYGAIMKLKYFSKGNN